ncbi:MAG: hypothetical protein QOF76_696 [Solirubrobacteraceae bacterium]|jgi:CRISPR/Cas system-associated exonuclease Cas4 (RecB family)|nr:hypothetical protein [Solirubrobacteraceae bacterium]
MTRSAILAALAAATIGVVGCGGGDSNKALSYSGFATAANKVCSDATSSTDKIAAKLNGKATNDAPVYDDLIPALQSATDKFKKLKPPAALKVDADKFAGLVESEVTAAKAAQTAAKTGDDAAYQTAAKAIGPIAKEANLEGSKLGAAECAKP